MKSNGIQDVAITAASCAYSANCEMQSFPSHFEYVGLQII